MPIEAIDPNPRNPRQVLLRDKAFVELVESIRQHGLLQPIVVRRDGVRRVMIAGHRRLAAVQQLAQETPEDPRWRLTRAKGSSWGLIENLHREDLTAQDEASALEALEHELGSLQAVADAIKRSKAYVSRRIRIYQDPTLAEAILKRGLPPTTAQEFLPVKDANQRRQLVQDALRERWDAPQARAAVQERCESQQDLEPSACAGERCDSQQPGAAHARSQAVLREIERIRRLLQAYPVSELEPSVTDELRAFVRDLRKQLVQR